MNSYVLIDVTLLCESLRTELEIKGIIYEKRVSNLACEWFDLFVDSHVLLKTTTSLQSSQIRNERSKIKDQIWKKMGTLNLFMQMVHSCTRSTLHSLIWSCNWRITLSLSHLAKRKNPYLLRSTQLLGTELTSIESILWRTRSPSEIIDWFNE